MAASEADAALGLVGAPVDLGASALEDGVEQIEKAELSECTSRLKTTLSQNIIKHEKRS